MGVLHLHVKEEAMSSSKDWQHVWSTGAQRKGEEAWHEHRKSSSRGKG